MQCTGVTGTCWIQPGPFRLSLDAKVNGPIFAILALKPKIIRAKNKQARSKTFFSNFYRKTLDQYKEEMQLVMKSREAIYDQLMTDMYHNGLVLERKYALLGISYTLFLLAIVCSVTAYIIVAVM